MRHQMESRVAVQAARAYLLALPLLGQLCLLLFQLVQLRVQLAQPLLCSLVCRGCLHACTPTICLEPMNGLPSYQTLACSNECTLKLSYIAISPGLGSSGNQ